MSAGKRNERPDVRIWRQLNEARPEGLRKEHLPTPALMVDLDRLEANLSRMAEHAAGYGKQLRPHAKTHKSPAIARRQVELGAVGVSVATIAEAQVMLESGIPNVLLTSPLGDPLKAAWVVELASRYGQLTVALDHPRQVQWYESACAQHSVTLPVLVDIDVGDHRTGVEPGPGAFELVEAVERADHLAFQGLQAYSGTSSHWEGYEQRRAHSLACLARVAEIKHALERRDVAVPVLSGGSTGTFDIDVEVDEITELQVGSYLFMDVDYRRIGGPDGKVFTAFEPALFVLTTVISANHATHVTVDAGGKALATDQPFLPQVRGVEGVRYTFFGDEFGRIELDQPDRSLELGDRLELLVPHCDPTVNLYDRLYACRGDRVEEIWPVMDRWPRPQP